MKTATIPPVRIEPAFRADMEQSLEEGESLAGLVETAVRNEVARRQMPSEFTRRGIASVQRTVDAGNGIPADAVIARLKERLSAAIGAQRP